MKVYNVKKFIKNLIPPLFWDIVQFAKDYKYFSRYRKLVVKNSELKDIHKGKRCFILGSGTSIKKENLKKLKNEIVFALNNFYVHEDFSEIMSGNIEKYYMTAPIHSPQTEKEWKEWFEDMEKYMPNNINMLFGINRDDINIKYIFDKYKIFKHHKINWYYAGKKFFYESFDKSAMDITRAIYEGEAVSIYSLIVALYMGFDEIYLVGMDHDYFLYNDESEMRMYSSAKHQKNEFARTFGNMFYINEFLRQYKIFSKYKIFDDNYSCKIFNTSSSSLLKVFPKVKFEDLFDQ